MTLAFLLTGAVAAQQPPVHQERIKIVQHARPGPGQPAGDVVQFVSAEFGWEDEVVKGAPYSAEAITETVQVLADGNRIARKNVALVHRDSEGRTRREHTMNAIGAWSADKPHKMIFLSDPAARVNYVLDPEDRTARKHALPPRPPAGSGPVRMEVEDVVVQAPAPAPPGGGEAVPVFTGEHGVFGAFIAGGQVEYKNEPLGRQIIEGVQAEGTRTVHTIPAGQIGNDRPIEIVSERWYSPELRTVVSSRRNDPRFGETVYRLTNIRRGEPDPSLFQPPADYTVREEGPGVRTMKFQEKNP